MDNGHRIIIDGWLQKEGHRIKTWKRRWVVVCFSEGGIKLEYYKDQALKNKKGEYIIAADSAVSSLDDGYSGGRSHLIALQAEGNGNLLILSAESEDGKAAWISALRDAIDAAKCIAESRWAKNAW